MLNTLSLLFLSRNNCSYFDFLLFLVSAKIPSMPYGPRELSTFLFPIESDKDRDLYVLGTEFFITKLLPKINLDQNQDLDLVYGALQQFRLETQTEVNLRHVYFTALDLINQTLMDSQLGEEPPNIFVLQKAFNLVSSAISESDSFLQEPGINQNYVSLHLNPEKFQQVVRDLQTIMNTQIDTLFSRYGVL
jgi:hypothetical protein